MLGAGGGLAAAVTAGCIGGVDGLLDTGTGDQLSLTVKTEPADYDTASTRIARHLVEHLKTVGIDARIELKPARELWKDVLLAGNYDIYVGRLPERGDPDFLRSLLHSAFGGESGWQNPFSYTDAAVDDMLSAQRRASSGERRDVMGDIQRRIATRQPFGVVASASDIWAARTDRFVGWSRHPPTDPLGYVGLESETDEREPSLRVATTNDAPTRNLNPLAVQHRSRAIFTGLLYDPLVRRVDGKMVPWLAAGWSWGSGSDGDVCTVSLRPNLTFHDGEDVTAEDVAFTYRFLNDTLLDGGDTPVPSPRFRGRASLVDGVTVTDDQTLRIRCPDTSSEVGTRALTVPVLPAHVWRDRAVEASAPWAPDAAPVSGALLQPNTTPVGSGVVQLRSRDEGESLVLARFDDHFLHRPATPNVPDTVALGVPFDTLSVRVVPSDQAAVQLLSADEADATAMRITPETIPAVGQDDVLQLYVEDSNGFYHVGFNARRPPLGTPSVRRAIVRLIDKSHIVETVFDGYAHPAATVLAGTDWEPSDLGWDGSDPAVPFVGEDGELDERRARRLFDDAGLEYSDEGAVLDR